jgi:hypothetical protein
LCIKHNLPCTAADKVLGTVTRDRQPVRAIESSNSGAEIADNEDGVIQVIPRNPPVPDDMIIPPLELSYIQSFLRPLSDDQFTSLWLFGSMDFVCRLRSMIEYHEYQLHTHALPKAVRYSLLLTCFWDRHTRNSPPRLADWEGDIRTQFYRSMRQSICDQDYGVVARAAGYILLSISGRFTLSERLKHLEGFATALGLFSKMLASPYEEVVTLYHIFLNTLGRLSPRLCMSANDFRDLCNLAIRSHRILQLDQIDFPISNSLRQIKFCIQIHFLDLLLETFVNCRHLSEIEYFRSAAQVLLRQFPFDAFFGDRYCQTLRDYLELFNESVRSCKGPVPLDHTYPPPPSLRGNLHEWLSALKNVSAVVVNFHLFGLGDIMTTNTVSPVEAAWTLVQLREFGSYFPQFHMQAPGRSLLLMAGAMLTPKLHDSDCTPHHHEYTNSE